LELQRQSYVVVSVGTCTAQVVDKLQADTDKWLANLTIHGYRFT